jgi:hypothetical protein
MAPLRPIALVPMMGKRVTALFAVRVEISQSSLVTREQWTVNHAGCTVSAR